MTKNNIEFRIFSLLLIALFITRVFEIPLFTLFNYFIHIVHHPFDISSYKISLYGLIIHIYSLSYFLGLIGVIGLFFAKRWSRILLMFYAIFEILATLTSSHDGLKIVLQFHPRFLLYYNIQGVFLALIILILLNIPSIKNKLT